MDRRQFLQTTAALTAASTIPLAGCAGLGGGGDTGSLATYVSDQPGDISDFERCIVTITEVRIQPVDGDPITESVDDAEADLVDLQGDARQLVDESELPAGEYEHVQLAISGVDATLSDGGSAQVDTAGDAGLKFQSFSVDGERAETVEIRADQTASFTADFTPVKQGQSGRYVLTPVAEEVTVVYEDVATTTA